MTKKILFIFIFSTLLVFKGFTQTASLKVTTTVSDELKNNFKENGRIFLFVSSNQQREPRTNTWPNKSNMIFATNLNDWNADNSFTFDENVPFVKSVEVSLNEIPTGKYKIQVLWDQDKTESRINAPGNLHSEAVLLDFTEDKTIELDLTKTIEPTKLIKHELVKEVNIKSKILSDWWGKEMRLKAAVVLPRNYYEDLNKTYAVRYNIAGYGGRYTRANRFERNMDWWTSEEAPEILNVYLDGEGPFGDCYQLDSDNSGPYGKALTEELIPHIENEYRAKGTAESRFVEGCSTGGWVSLALQLFYADFFGGCFSYSPDAVDFENFQLINIYRDKNAFYNEYDYLRPIVRNVTGEPILSQKDFIQFENVLGWSDTYVTSGGQFSAFTALYSEKGEDGLPKPLFHPATGEIDNNIAEYWKKYDLKHFVENNWESLGPKIQGKIWIWAADMDHFYLNHATRTFDEMLQKMDNPKSDASVNFTPVTGHCAEYNEKKVILQIAEKIENMNN
mgnify:CR=1 FL=1